MFSLIPHLHHCANGASPVLPVCHILGAGVNYNPTLPSIGHITRRHHNILHASEWLKQAIPSPPIITFSCPKSLRDLLVQAELKTSEHSPPGNQRYGSSRCKTCPKLRTTAEFTSHSIGQQYQLKTTASCKTMNVRSLYDPV